MTTTNTLSCDELFRRILLNLEALNMLFNGNLPDYTITQQN